MSKQVQNTITTTAPNPFSGMLHILKTVFISYCISILLLFILSIFTTFNPLSDSVIYIAVNTITAFGVFFCGFRSGRHFESKGLIFGSLSGIIYAVILLLLGMLFSKNASPKAGIFTTFAIGIICGAVGGIVGINTKKQNRR